MFKFQYVYVHYVNRHYSQIPQLSLAIGDVSSKPAVRRFARRGKVSLSSCREIVSGACMSEGGATPCLALCIDSSLCGLSLCSLNLSCRLPRF